jgi:hypothetical protein
MILMKEMFASPAEDATEEIDETGKSARRSNGI